MIRPRKSTLIRSASYCDIIRTAVNEWSLRVHFAQTLSAGNVPYQTHYTCTPASAGIVHLDAVQSTECHMTRFEPIRLQNILGSCIMYNIHYAKMAARNYNAFVLRISRDQYLQ